MKNNFAYGMHVLRLCVGVAAFCMLASCGESSNLADPDQNGIVKACSDLKDTTCTKGFFIDDAVENLDYECGRVKSVTAEDGFFSCPTGSTLTFSITNPDDVSGKKIILGKITKLEANSKLGIDTFLYVRPSSLSSDTVTATNIARLLQAFNSVPASSALEQPARVLTISDADKRKLVNLPATVDATAINNPFTRVEPGVDTIEDVLAPFMTAIGKTLVTEANARALLKKGFYSTVAGSYYNPGYFLPTNIFGPDTHTGGMDGLNANGYFLGATWTAVDRKGRMFGFGIYSTGPATTRSACRFLLPLLSCDDAATGATEVQPDRLPMRINTNTGLWPVWSDNSAWSFSYDLLNAAATSAIPGTLTMQGSVDRGGVAGSADIYAQYYGAGTVAPPLGKWSFTGSPNFPAGDTRFTLVRGRAVAATLAPAYWVADPEPGARLHFPMNVLATFYDSSCGTATPLPGAGHCPLVSTLKFTILADGNIVSNIHNHCGSAAANLNSTTLLSNNGQEYPIGVVAQVFGTNFANNIPSRLYISPIIIIPENAAFPEELRGIQIGTSSEISDTDTIGRVRLRVEKDSAMVTPSLYLETFDDAALSDLEGARRATDTPKTAYWNSQRVYLRGGAGYDGYFTTVPDPACPAQP